MIIKNYIFDWKRTLFDPDTGELISGAKAVLDYVKTQSKPMILVGKGGADMYGAANKLGVSNYFKDIKFNEGDKESSLYDDFVDKHSPAESVFIGDRLNSEIAVGNNMGATTIWVRQGQFANEPAEPSSGQPTYTVNSLPELKELLTKLAD